MQPGVFRALEFDRVRDALARLALTPLGRSRVQALEPATEMEAVHRTLATTVDAVAFVQDGGSLGLWAPDDLPAILSVLDISDQPLEPLALIGLARFVESTMTVASAIRQGRRTEMARIAEGAASFDGEIGRIRHAIDPAGEVADRASEALRDIRESLRRQRARLRSTLDALTRGRDTAKYLQDQIITDRNGRYVVVVRAEHREAIPGIVHGSSASGASLYLEPLSTVGLNNDVVALVEREKAEIYRILLALTNGFRLRADELAATLDAAADFDELYAKVELARRMDGVAPNLSPDGVLDFRGARHPLLIPAVRELIEGHRAEHATVIASDLRITPPARALVVSGPNTGGKTVALKAFGLLSLMAQAGLLIPAERGSRFTPFRTVFADIGDEQSISASLSTFSAHIANIVSMDRALASPSLVLLDEVGGGTDPVEGGALGAAIIDHFRRRGALVVATTHDDGVKTYAATSEGVATAGFGFNPDTYAPTYRLVYGTPGRSLALEIAERLGLASAVIQDARSRRSTREAQLADHLQRIDAELAGVARTRDELAAERNAVQQEREGLQGRETRLAEREAVLKRRLDDRLNEKLREARAEVDRVVGTLKQRAESLTTEIERRGPALSTGDLGQLRAEARTALSAIGEAIEPASAAPQVDALDEPPDAGQKVFVSTFNTNGIVRSVSGRQVEVEILGKRMRVPLAALRRPAESAPARPSTSRSAPVSVGAASRPAGASRELVVIGSTVDEAIDRTEKFLDSALLADERRLRIVHGHGTGRLRDALARFLREHPLVASASPAPDNEGGNGATIVELRD